MPLPRDTALMRIVLLALAPALAACVIPDKFAAGDWVPLDDDDVTVGSEEDIAPPPPPPGGGPPLDEIPPTLEATGLFAPTGVHEFSPQWHLYSDGATKRRWISLPPNAQIDTTKPDYWRFPVGTKLWKEFTRNGTLVETRYMVKYGAADRDWLFIAYRWSADGSTALPVPNGATNVNGTAHDIPAQTTCLGCHGNVASRVLGFSQFQLDYPAAADLVDLGSAASLGWLSTPIIHTPVPGTQQQRATLGYFHANCGHCHNSKSPLINRPMFRLESDHIATVSSTRTYQSTVNVAGTSFGGATIVAKPGDPDHSIIVTRMRATDPKKRMPALGIETIDTAAVTMIRAWITSL